MRLKSKKKELKDVVQVGVESRGSDVSMCVQEKIKTIQEENKLQAKR